MKQITKYFSFNSIFLISLIILASTSITYLDTHVPDDIFNVPTELMHSIFSLTLKLILLTIVLSYIWFMFKNVVLDVALGRNGWPKDGEDIIRASVIIGLSLVAGFALLGFMTGGIY